MARFDSESEQYYQDTLSSLLENQVYDPPLNPWFNYRGFGYSKGYHPDAWDSAIALQALLTQSPLVPDENLYDDPVLSCLDLLAEKVVFLF